METVSIRRAHKNDASSIADVLERSQWFTYEKLFVKDYIQNLIDNYYNVERIQKEIVSISEEWHGYFIAEMNGLVVGVIGGGMTDGTCGEIYVLYLDPNIRGNGIGTRLLNFFTKIQKHTYGASEQWVAVAKGNDFGIPFYEARGFVFQYEELSYGTTKDDQDISLKYRRKI
ncbi:GNAT family N-acetyltransferase [Sporosarcina limicola]|uniref:GNAT superfamily N-acetyltransferase n=1 Tax=Sporosarcina limicola TaxID=34101 RepID=A0A927MMR6_9BACL|nr:GNAT family N-acetyltransferase [Sporosarcina limicola]MBE1554334.1 GNAT superfamily N-acetyltransferase [Sporosarcina limicola]